MNVVCKSNERVLISMTLADLLAISNALNEVCNGIHIPDVDFHNRLGVTREEARSTLDEVSAAFDATASGTEVCRAWNDGGSVMIKAVTVAGDPVELGEQEAQEFLASLAAAPRVSR